MLEHTIQDKLRETFPTRLDLTPEELAEPRPFNVFGEDCILDNAVRQRLPLSLETMHSDEAFETIYECYDNAEARHSGQLRPYQKWLSQDNKDSNEHNKTIRHGNG